MRKVGNLTSNKLYNPQNKKPAIPIDADEADSAIERFIRSKYMNQGLSSMRTHNTGSTGSDETPPPLPPKSHSKFSLRSASSTFPLFSRTKKDRTSRSAYSSPQLPPDSPESPQSHGHRPKVSKVFGASLGIDNEDDTQKKMAKLRELGFTDDRKNETILKGMNGNLERTIETLVRLEGRSPVASPGDEFPSVSRPSVSTSNSAGLTVARAETARPMSASNNPFNVSPVQPISTQSTGNLANRNPYFSNNPFGIVTTQSNDALNQAFNNMTIGASQPLFPHHTGGLPNQQTQQLMYQQQQQQSMVPPVPAIPQNYASAAYNYHQAFQQQPQQPELQPAQPLQPAHTGYNPFLNNAHTNQAPIQPSLQIPSHTGLVSTPTGTYANNPFNRSPTRVASPSTLTQIPEQSQQNFYNTAVQQQAAQMNNPFLAQQVTGVAGVYNPQQVPYNPFGQPMVQQAPPRADKASILALYNYPQLAPQTQQNLSTEQQQQPPQMNQPQPQQATVSMNQVLHVAPVSEAAQAPAAMVAPGNKNPFLGNGAAPPQMSAQTDGPVGNRSRDSMMALGMEWSNGRHSPDAFASLSARS